MKIEYGMSKEEVAKIVREHVTKKISDEERVLLGEGLVELDKYNKPFCVVTFETPEDEL